MFDNYQNMTIWHRGWMPSITILSRMPGLARKWLIRVVLEELRVLFTIFSALLLLCNAETVFSHELQQGKTQERRL